MRRIHPIYEEVTALIFAFFKSLRKRIERIKDGFIFFTQSLEGLFAKAKRPCFSKFFGLGKTDISRTCILGEKILGSKNGQ
jgi:hypothetical protein